MSDFTDDSYRFAHEINEIDKTMNITDLLSLPAKDLKDFHKLIVGEEKQ